MSETDPTNRTLFRIAAIDPEEITAAVLRHTARIASLLPPGAEIEHVGATAVPGSLTKGDIDLVVRVRAEDFAAADRALATLLPRNTGSYRSAEFASFADGQAKPELGVQLVVKGSALDVFGAFRDALLADAALIESYNDLKRSWDGLEMDAYRSAKAASSSALLRGRRMMKKLEAPPRNERTPQHVKV